MLDEFTICGPIKHKKLGLPATKPKPDSWPACKIELYPYLSEKSWQKVNAWRKKKDKKFLVLMEYILVFQEHLAGDFKDLILCTLNNVPFSKMESGDGSRVIRAGFTIPGISGLHEGAGRTPLNAMGDGQALPSVPAHQVDTSLQEIWSEIMNLIYEIKQTSYKNRLLHPGCHPYKGL